MSARRIRLGAVLGFVLALGLVLPPDHRVLRVVEGESFGHGRWCQISILNPMEIAEVGMMQVSDEAWCAALAARGATPARESRRRFRRFYAEVLANLFTP